MFCFTIERDVNGKLLLRGVPADRGEAVEQRVVSRLFGAYEVILDEETDRELELMRGNPPAEGRLATTPLIQPGPEIGLGAGSELPPANFGLQPRPTSGNDADQRPGGDSGSEQFTAEAITALGRGGWFREEGGRLRPIVSATPVSEGTRRSGGELGPNSSRPRMESVVLGAGIPEAAHDAAAQSPPEGGAVTPIVGRDITEQDNPGQWIGRDYRIPLNDDDSSLRELISDSVFTNTLGPDGLEGVISTPALWGVAPTGDVAANPIFILANRTVDGVQAARTSGEARQVTFEEFAELVAADLATLNATETAPLVLLTPFAGMGNLRLPRAIAARTARLVWAFSGDLEISDGRITALASSRSIPVEERDPTGAWILSTPDLAGPLHESDVVAAANGVIGTDGRFVPDSMIWAYPIPGDGHRSAGHAAHGPGDQSVREEIQAEFSQKRSPDDSDTGVFEWFGKQAYFFSGHADANTVDLPSDSGVVEVGAAEFARYLGRRRSLEALPKESPVVLVACSTGAMDATVAQEVANWTGRDTYAPTGELLETLEFVPQEDGSVGRFRHFRPQAIEDSFIGNYYAPGHQGPGTVPPAESVPSSSSSELLPNAARRGDATRGASSTRTPRAARRNRPGGETGQGGGLTRLMQDNPHVQRAAVGNEEALEAIFELRPALVGILADAPNTLDALVVASKTTLTYYRDHPESLDLLTTRRVRAMEEDPDLLAYLFTVGRGYGLAALKKLNGDIGLLETTARISSALLEPVAEVPWYAGIIIGHRDRGGDVRALLAQLALSSSIQVGLTERATDGLQAPSLPELKLLVKPDIMSALQSYGVHARIVVKTPGMLAALDQSMGTANRPHLLRQLADQAARDDGPVLSDVLLDSPVLARKLAEWPELVAVATTSAAVAAQLSENPAAYDEAARNGKRALQAALTGAQPPDWVGMPAGSPELKRALARAKIIGTDEEETLAIEKALPALEAPHEFRRLLDRPYLVEAVVFDGSTDPVHVPGILRAAVWMPKHAYDHIGIDPHDHDLYLGSAWAQKFGDLPRRNQQMQLVLRRNPLLLNYLREPEIAEVITGLPSVAADAPFDERVMNLRRLNKQLLGLLSPTSQDRDNAVADRLMSMLMFDDAPLLRILSAAPEIVHVFVERIQEDPLRLRDDVTRLHQGGLLRFFAESPNPLMTAAHWARLLSDHGLATLLGRLAMPGQGLSRAVAGRPSLVPEVIARPGAIRPGVEGALVRALAEENTTRRETLLAEAIEEAGEPVLTPEGVRIVPTLLPAAEALLGEHPKYSLGLALAVAAQKDLAAAMDTRPTLRDLLLRSADAVRIVHDYPRFTQALLDDDDLYRQFTTNHRVLLGLRHLGRKIDSVIENPLLLRAEAEHSKSQLQFGNNEAFRRLLWERGPYLARALSHSEAWVLDALSMYGNQLLDALSRVEEHRVHAALMGHTPLLWLMAEEPALLQALIERPALAGALARADELSREQYKNLLGDGDLADRLNSDPEMAASVLRSPELLTAVIRRTGVGRAALSSAETGRLLASHDNLRALAGREPALAQRLTESPALASALTANTRLAQVIANDGRVREQLLNNPHLLAAVVADPDLVVHRRSTLWALATRTPQLAQVLNPDMRRALTASADLTSVAAKLADRPDWGQLRLPLPDEWEYLWRTKGLPVFLGSKQRLASEFLTNPQLREDLGPDGLDAARGLAERDGQALASLLREDPSNWAAALRAAAANAGTAASAQVGTPVGPRTGTGPAPAPATTPRRERPAGRGPVGSGQGLGLLEGGGLWLADALAVPDPRLARALDDNRLLLPLLAADPDAAAHLTEFPEQHSDYQYQPDVTRSARDDFAQWLASSPAAPASSAYDRLRVAAATVHALALHDREQRLAAIREADISTWQLSGEIHYVGRLEEQFTEADIADLKKAATGVAIRESSSTVVLHQPLHTHLRGGSGGAAFTFVVTKDGTVAALVYARSTARSGNAYRWDGHHGRYMDGPPGTDFIHNTEAMKESRNLLKEAERYRQDAERRAGQPSAASLARTADLHEAQRARISAYHRAVGHLAELLDGAQDAAVTQRLDTVLRELNTAITVLTLDERAILGVTPDHHPRLLKLVTRATSAVLTSPVPQPAPGRRRGRGTVAPTSGGYVTRVRARLTADRGGAGTPADVARDILTPAVLDTPDASSARPDTSGPGNRQSIIAQPALIPADVGERFGRALHYGKGLTGASTSPDYWFHGKPAAGYGGTGGKEASGYDWGSDGETVVGVASDLDDKDSDTETVVVSDGDSETGDKPSLEPTVKALGDVVGDQGLVHLAELTGRPAPKPDRAGELMARLADRIGGAFLEAHGGYIPTDARLVLEVEVGHSLIAPVVAQRVATKLRRPIYLRVNGMGVEIKICWD